MKQTIEKQIAIRNEIIASLERENKIQAELIRVLQNMVATLEDQNTELQNLLEEILEK